MVIFVAIATRHTADEHENMPRKHVLSDSIYEMSRMGKSTQTECRLMAARGWGWGGASPVTLSAMQEPRVPSWVRKMPAGEPWQPTQVCLPGKSHGTRRATKLQSTALQKSRTQLKRFKQAQGLGEGNVECLLDKYGVSIWVIKCSATR